MRTINSQRNAGLAILLTWCVYIAFALLTDWKDYGLIAQPKGHLRWTIARLSTVSLWLFVAALLLRYRKHPVNWRSFSYSFIATGIIAFVVSSSLVAGSVNYTPIVITIVFYALVSGFLCVTVRKPTIAAVLGLVFFVARFLSMRLRTYYRAYFAFTKIL
jgi:hypothetical protein